MAIETLSVAEMIPNKFEPKRTNRWIFALEGIDSFLVKSASRPQIQINAQTINYINSQRHIAGKATWQDISVDLYDPIAPSGAQQVMEWVRTHHETVSGRAGYADFYKRDCQIKLLDPVGTVIELWDMKGCQLTSANFNGLQYDDEGTPLTIQLGIKFDNCVLQY
jgi:hypothetical protein